MSMNRRSRSVTKPRFQLFRGNGEAERLDRFLAAADPLAVAAPEPETRKDRSGKGILGFVLFLGAASLIPILWQSWSLAEDPGEPRTYQEGARRLVDPGQRLLQEDRNDVALDAFSLAAQLAPDDAETWSALAGCQLRTYQSV